MSDISAIYILQYLDNFDHIVKTHKYLYQYFKNKLQKLTTISFKLFPYFHDGDKIIPSCFCLLFDEYNDNIRLKLLEKDVFCRKYYHPLKDTKNTLEIYDKILCVPCHVNMTEKDIDFILDIVMSI